MHVVRTPADVPTDPACPRTPPPHPPHPHTHTRWRRYVLGEVEACMQHPLPAGRVEKDKLTVCYASAPRPTIRNDAIWLHHRCARMCLRACVRACVCVCVGVVGFCVCVWLGGGEGRVSGLPGARLSLRLPRTLPPRFNPLSSHPPARPSTCPPAPPRFADDPLVKLAVSTALAQSTSLSVHEMNARRLGRLIGEGVRVRV